MKCFNFKNSYHAFDEHWEPNAELALDTIAMRPTRGLAVGGFGINDMQWSHLEELSGNPPGSYAKDPVRVYLAFQLMAGVCFIDQWIPENPLSIRDQGYESEKPRGATTGATEIVRDGRVIDSPEAVVEHMEKVVFPRLIQSKRSLADELAGDPDTRVRQLIENEVAVQILFGMNLLKGPYNGFQAKPHFGYGTYGYANIEQGMSNDQILKLDIPCWLLDIEVTVYCCHCKRDGIYPIIKRTQEKYKLMRHATLEPIVGDIAFPEAWTVFAPLKRDDPVMDRTLMTTIPAELRVGGQVVKPERVISTRGQVDFEPFFGPNPEGFHKTAYIFLRLEAAQAGAVSLGVGWDYLLDLWLNGEPLLDKPEAENPNQPISVTNHRLTLNLKAGENILVARLTGGGGPVILALAGPRELRAGDFRRILDDPARIDPGWCDLALKARPGGKDAVDIGDRRELFVDDFLVDGLSGAATRRLHHPVPREVVMTFGARGEPWEGNIGYPTVFHDGERIRLYYSGRSQKGIADESPEQYTCLAESTDGVQFTRPELGLFEFQGSRKNNIVWHGSPSHNFTPFRDDNPSASEDQRYKAIGYHPKGGGLGAFGSPDGIHWRLLAEEPIITEGAFDSQNLAFWDPLRGVYVDFHRGFRGARFGHRMLGYRDIMTCVSEDFLHWSEPRLIEYDDARRYHLYTNAIRPYFRAPHIYLGTPARFMSTRKKIDVHPHSGISDALLMSSRDGIHFQRWNEGFIRPSPEPENWTDRNQYPTWGMLELTPGELSLYWGEHNKHPEKRLRRGTLRVDGFASLHAGGEGVGEMLTRPLVFAGRRLEINYATSAAGTMLFALCDEAGEAFEGFSFDDSEMLYGNELAHIVTWRGVMSDLSQFAGRAVRLRVRLQDADLYAIRFVR